MILGLKTFITKIVGNHELLLNLLIKRIYSKEELNNKMACKGFLVKLYIDHGRVNNFIFFNITKHKKVSEHHIFSQEIYHVNGLIFFV